MVLLHFYLLPQGFCEEAEPELQHPWVASPGFGSRSRTPRVELLATAPGGTEGDTGPAGARQCRGVPVGHPLPPHPAPTASAGCSSPARSTAGSSPAVGTGKASEEGLLLLTLSLLLLYFEDKARLEAVWAGNAPQAGSTCSAAPDTGSWINATSSLGRRASARTDHGSSAPHGKAGEPVARSPWSSPPRTPTTGRAWTVPGSTRAPRWALGR